MTPFSGSGFLWWSAKPRFFISSRAIRLLHGSVCQLTRSKCCPRQASPWICLPVHAAREIFLGQVAARILIDAAHLLHARQVCLHRLLAFTCDGEIQTSSEPLSDSVGAPVMASLCTKLTFMVQWKAATLRPMHWVSSDLDIPPCENGGTVFASNVRRGLGRGQRSRATECAHDSRLCTILIRQGIRQKPSGEASKCWAVVRWISPLVGYNLFSRRPCCPFLHISPSTRASASALREVPL